MISKIAKKKQKIIKIYYPFYCLYKGCIKTETPYRSGSVPDFYGKKGLDFVVKILFSSTA